MKSIEGVGGNYGVPINIYNRFVSNHNIWIY